MKITTIYDNYKKREDMKKGWGFSCLVETNNKKILFDAGEDFENLFYNMQKLEIKPEEIDLIVISHEHWDHTGGLSEIKKLTKAKICMPTDFSKPAKLIENVYTTGALGTAIKEQSLILKTSKGLAIITGCAHPGIVNIVKTSKTFIKEDIFLVLGGFHLPDLSDEEIIDIIEEFETIGVKKAAPSHCTGERAIELFREEYKENFIDNGAGKIIEL